MDDFIRRQAVKELAYKQIREKYCGIALKEQRDFYIKLADSIIDLLPSAEPQIIHCKDCKWKDGSKCVRFAEIRPFPNDFCSRAERRVDEEVQDNS